MSRCRVSTNLAMLALALLPVSPPVQAADKGKGDLHERCASACADCAVRCASCSRHSVLLLKGGEFKDYDLILRCSDCATICSAAAVVAGGKGPLAAAQCEACAKACDSCRAVCNLYRGDEQMRACSKACEECAKVCRELVKQVGG